MNSKGIKPEYYCVSQAQTMLYVPSQYIEQLQREVIEQNNLFKTARIAGILAAKRTDELIPLRCSVHLHAIDVSFEIFTDHILIIATVDAITSTQVDIEALTAANIAGLTLFDMLKSDYQIEDMSLDQCKIIKQNNKKHSINLTLKKNVAAAVLLLSDRVFSGKKQDSTGQMVCEVLTQAGFTPIHYEILPEQTADLQQRVIELSKNVGLVMTLGGTGLAKKDTTTDVLEPLIDRKVDGLMEAARAFGQRLTPYSAMSRGVSGFIDNTLLLTLPGSSGGAEESLTALLPAIVHLFDGNAKAAK